MIKQGRIRVAIGAAAAALALATVTIGVAYAQQQQAQPPAGQGRGMAMGRGMVMGRGMMGPMFGGGPGMAVLRLGLAQLNPTDQQKEQVKGILQGHREQLQALATQGLQARMALSDAVAAGADEPTIRAKAADAAKVQADAAVLGAQLRQEILGVLTPEQQAKAKELLQNRQDRMQRMLQRRGKMLSF